MTLSNISRSHLSIQVDANESIDTEFFHKQTGQVTLCPSYFVGTGNVEVSADDQTWVSITGDQNELFSNTLNYPRYIRLTAEGTFHFNIRK